MKGLKVEKISELIDFKREVHVFKEVTSTNDVAFSLGGIVFATTQTNGRGRLGRSFYSGEGGLYFSLAIDLNGDLLENTNIPFSSGRLTVAAGIAVAKALIFYGVDAKIKWVNDVFVLGKKVCGILAERRESRIVVGIGVNVNSVMPSELSLKASSLKLDLDMNELAAKIINEFYVQLVCPDLKFLNRNCITIGKTVSSALGVGKAVSIDEFGALIVEIDGEHKRLFTGEAQSVD